VRGAKSRLPDGLNRIIALAVAVPERAGAARNSGKAPFLERLGASFLALPQKANDVLEFLGEVSVALLRY